MLLLCELYLLMTIFVFSWFLEPRTFQSLTRGIFGTIFVYPKCIPHPPNHKKKLTRLYSIATMPVEDTGRSQLFKNSSRADDSRRNRQDMVSKLRKDKRNEQMLKRRQVRLGFFVLNWLEINCYWSGTSKDLIYFGVFSIIWQRSPFFTMGFPKT